jgi:hypothetical protein
MQATSLITRARFNTGCMRTGTRLLCLGSSSTAGRPTLRISTDGPSPATWLLRYAVQHRRQDRERNRVLHLFHRAASLGVPQLVRSPRRNPVAHVRDADRSSSPGHPRNRHENAPIPSWSANPAQEETDLSDKPGYVAEESTDLSKVKRVRKHRLLSLASVDHLVGSLVQRLKGPERGQHHDLVSTR